MARVPRNCKCNRGAGNFPALAFDVARLICYYVSIFFIAVYFTGNTGHHSACCRMTSLVIPTAMRAKNDMITQAIKRWWRKLWAWLPWRNASPTTYTETVTNLNQGTTQESLWRTTMDGPLPQ